MFICLIGLYNFLHQRMTHHVGTGQVAEPDVVNPFQHLKGSVQTGNSASRKVFLGLVSCYDDLGTKPILVRNIFIWAGVVFWASSRIM